MANPNLFTITTFTIAILLSSTFTATAIPGGRAKLDDVESDKEIQDLGRYSVAEYNRLRRSDGAVENLGEDLTFYRVVDAEKQVVSGMKYYLTIEAFSKTSGGPRVFEAVVVVKPWLRSKRLTKFAPSPAPVVSLM